MNDYLLAKKCTNPECAKFIHTTKNTCQCGTVLTLFYDYFALFNLAPYSHFNSDTQFLETLKKAYKLLSLQFHPDVNSSPHAARSFSLVQTGFQTLSNLESRNDYLDDLETFEDLYQHDEIHTEDITQTTENPPENEPTKEPSNSSIRQLNIISGLILAVIAFITLRYQQNTTIAFVSATLIVALAFSVNSFFKGLLILLEVTSFIIIFIIITSGQLAIAMVCAGLLFVYFYKAKKKLRQIMPAMKF